MNTASTIEREKFIVDCFISLMEENRSTVISYETVEVMKESLQAIQDELEKGRCPAHLVKKVKTSLEQGQKALRWLKQHRAPTISSSMPVSPRRNPIQSPYAATPVATK